MPPERTKARIHLVSGAALLIAAVLIITCGAKKDLEQNIPVQYEMRQIEDSYGNCEDSNTGCAHILIRYPAIIQAPTKAAEDSLNDFVKSFIMQSSETDDVQGYQGLVSNFLNEYENLKAERPSYNIHWYDRKYVSIINDTFDILVLDYTEDIYTGGAHPDAVTYYANLTHYGKRLELTDLLKDGYWPILNNIADSIFRAMNGIPKKRTLLNSGYWFENGEFRLNENFYITPKGLEFYFNTNEIGPYSKGVTEIFIPYAAIKNYIRKDGPLGAVLNDL